MTAVAGDFYEFVLVDRNRAGFLVADVSGHGVPAALIAAMIKVAMQSVVSCAQEPREVLRGLNRVLFGQLRGAIPPRSEDNLKPCFRDRSHKQGRENALAADGCGQLSQRVLLEGAARIGLRLG